jgi:hypothetical protein
MKDFEHWPIWGHLEYIVRVALAVLFVAAIVQCGRLSVDDICKLNPKLCAVPSPSPSQWPDGTLVCRDVLLHPPVKCAGDCAFKSVADCACPPGQHVSYSAESHGAHGDIGCLPDVKPSPTPSAIPSAAPSPIEPSPSPLPSPSPVADLDIPQDAEWEFVGDVDPELAEQFARTYTPRLVDVIHGVLKDISGCEPRSLCPVPQLAQDFHELVIARLQAKGYRAGQHHDRNHPDPANGSPSDNVVFGYGPDADVPAWVKAIQLEHHDYVSSGRVGWGNKGSLWRQVGSGDVEPSPGPSPSPRPSPTPTPETHARPRVTGGPVSLKAGQPAFLQCNGASPGWPITHFQPHGSVGVRFTWKGGDPSDTLTITPRADTGSGFIVAYCELRENTDPSHVTSDNFRLWVTP